MSIPRDDYGRPLVILPGGGKPVPYQRCTTFIDVLEDKFQLGQWRERQVAIGLGRNLDHLRQFILATKDGVGGVMEAIHETAGSNDASRWGTKMHALTELVDKGFDVHEMLLSAKEEPDLLAYKKTMESVRVLETETFVVEDDLRVGGTFDKILDIDGENFIADVKTGGVKYPDQRRKYPMQMAVYARSSRYNPDTGERSPLNVSLKRAYIIHLPAGEGRCSLIPCDIEAAAKGIWLAADVREWRKNKGFYLESR